MRGDLGRRLGYWGMILVLLFFTVNGYIQSSNNNSLLHRAAKDRSTLVQNVGVLLQKNTAQTITIRNLRNALIQQNKILRKAGLKTTNIPKVFSTTTINKSQTSVSPSPEPTVTVTTKPTHKPTSKPTHKPKPKKTPNPLKSVSQDICTLTGVCITKGLPLSRIF
jgi:hypothetical protein